MNDLVPKDRGALRLPDPAAQPLAQGARPRAVLSDPLVAVEYAAAFAKLAPIYIASGLAPAGMTPQQFTMICLEGVALGIPFTMALRLLYVTSKGNRLGMMVDLQWALAMDSGQIEDFQVAKSTDQEAHVRIKRRGMGWSDGSYTIEEAKRAGLLGKDNWVKDPKAMLIARAKGRALKPFADIWNGLPGPDEAETTTETSGPTAPFPGPLTAAEDPKTPPAPSLPPFHDYLIPSGSKEGHLLHEVPVATLKELRSYLKKPIAKAVNEKHPEFLPNLEAYLA